MKPAHVLLDRLGRPGRILEVSRRPVSKYRRAVVAVVGLAFGGVLVAAFLIGLQPRRAGVKSAASGRENDPAQILQPTVDFRGLASSYADLGDFLRADRRPSPPAVTTAEPSTPLPPTPGGANSNPTGIARPEAAFQSQAAAIASPIFASATPSPGALKASMQGPTAQLEPPPSALASEEAAIDPADKGAQLASPNRTEQKRAFLSSSKGDTDTLDSPYAGPTSAYEVKAGDIISAALVTALNSDLPGSVIAQVTRSVFDHATGEHLLIPQGARLFGKYDSQITYGQRRALVVWTRIIMPDGRSMNIGAMEGADLEGGSGLADRVDSHVGAVTRAIALSTAIVVGGAVAQTAAARSSSNLVLDDAAGGVSTQSSQVGQRFVDRDLNRQPTLQIRAGWPVTVIVNKDLAMAPY